MKSERDLTLESLRGIAAVVVVLWHNMLAFFPARSGIFSELDPGEAISGQIWFGVLNGPAVVVFFFVLSGFVLTHRAILTGDASLLLRGLVKRWPRLAGPVVVVTVFSFLLFHFQLYHFSQAAPLTGSPWLQSFGFAKPIPYGKDLFDAFFQGSVSTFLWGDANFDSSLWTMRYEFYGSLASFALAYLLIFARPFHPVASLIVIGLIGVEASYFTPLFVAFVVGVALARFWPSNPRILPTWAAVCLIVAATYMFGFSAPARGGFIPLAYLFPKDLSPTYIYILASVLVLVTVKLCAPISRFLSRRFLVFLGRVSFPLYLVHIPILCSLGSLTLLLCARFLPATPAYAVAGKGLAVAITILASLVVAAGLSVLNDWWVQRINGAYESLARRVADRMRPQASGSPAPNSAAPPPRFAGQPSE
jgi:peptidoglycan/LPS O-acetylase OafA/YrhL